MRLLLTMCLGIALVGCSDAQQHAADHPPDEGRALSAKTGTDARAAGELTWLPEAIRLPGDFETVANRSLGRSTRILQGRTAANADSLLADYRAALAEAGYQITPTDERILFHGNGVAQGSVGFADTLDMGRVLQIDVTQETP